MREDHCVDEPDAARQPARDLVGDGLEESDRREYRSEDLRAGAESHVQPVADDSVGDEPAGEGIEGK